MATPKRTCGECEHFNPIPGDGGGRCLPPIKFPMWAVWAVPIMFGNDDATHCETFKPKIKGEE